MGGSLRVAEDYPVSRALAANLTQSRKYLQANFSLAAAQ